ncbi:hypothetical protein D3C72_731510 [compost metagenome]
MSHDASNIISVPPPGGDFTLGPYLDTVYRWAEAQGWCQPELETGWKFFAQPGPQDAPGLPDAKDPDAHDQLLRFWSWFALERKLSEGDRPIDRFLAAHAKDLTDEGRATYEGLGRSVFGAFKVAKTMPGRLVVLEGLAEGDAYSIPDRALANELQKGDLVVGRLYPFQDAYLADPDIHIGDMHEAPPARRITAPEAEAEYYAAMVPSKGHVMDVIDALLVQIDSPLTADDVFEMIKQAASLEAFLDEVYAAPLYKLRYLHMRDRSLLDELLQELWDTAGPLQDAQLDTEDALALTRTVRQALKAIAEGDLEALRPLLTPKGFLPMYLEIFGMRGIQRLSDVMDGVPATGVRAKHQLLPKDGGIFTTASWGQGAERHAAGLVSHKTTDGTWQVSDVAPAEPAPPAVMRAFEKASHLGWAEGNAPDPVEARLRAAVVEVGYSVHDAIDLFRLWRDFKQATDPDLSQPGIWAAGVELADSRYRNEDVDIKALAKSYGVFPRAIEGAADQIDEALRRLQSE